MGKLSSNLCEYLGQAAEWDDVFYAPCHEMAEGRIEFTLSVCVCLCVLESCPGHNLAVHDGIRK